MFLFILPPLTPKALLGTIIGLPVLMLASLMVLHQVDVYNSEPRASHVPSTVAFPPVTPVVVTPPVRTPAQLAQDQQRDAIVANVTRFADERAKEAPTALTGEAMTSQQWSSFSQWMGTHTGKPHGQGVASPATTVQEAPAMAAPVQPVNPGVAEAPIYRPRS